MISRDTLNTYLAQYLRISEFNDLGPNGLQVEGRNEISKIIFAVSAGVELFEKAITAEADAIIVHHGIIWDFERPVYRGGYKKRVGLLLKHDINLFAYHLPLDAHPEVGNNAVIAKTLGLRQVEPFGDYKGQLVGFSGIPAEPNAKKFTSMVREKLNPDSLIFSYGPEHLQRVGVISGGAQKDVTQAVAAGLDMFITGEVSEHILNYVKEEKIHFISAGHYATERFGVLALAEHLKQQYDVQTEFIDIPNPV